MKIKAMLKKWIATAVVAGTTATVLSSCYVETRRPHHHPVARRTTVIVR